MGPDKKSNANFIAAANPAVVLELVRRLRETDGMTERSHYGAKEVQRDADRRCVMSRSRLAEAARKVIERWDSPLWKDLPHTGESINALREALALEEQTRAKPVRLTEELRALKLDQKTEMTERAQFEAWMVSRGTSLVIEHPQAFDAWMAAKVIEREACARLCEKLADYRFAAYGSRDHDTGATYYSGPDAEEFEARDEEDNNCAAAIRANGLLPAEEQAKIEDKK